MKRIFLILAMCLCITGLLPSQKVKADIDGGEPKYANALEYFESIGMGDGFREIYNEDYMYLVEYSESLNRYHIHAFAYDDIYLNASSSRFRALRTSGETMTKDFVHFYFVSLGWDDENERVWKYSEERTFSFGNDVTVAGTKYQYYGFAIYSPQMYADCVVYSDLDLYTGDWTVYEQGTPCYYSDRKPVEEYIYFQTAQFDSVLDWLHYHGITCFDDYYDETKKYVVVPSSFSEDEGGAYTKKIMIHEYDIDGLFVSQTYEYTNTNGNYRGVFSRISPVNTQTLSYKGYNILIEDNVVETINEYNDKKYTSLSRIYSDDNARYDFADEQKIPVLYTDFPVYYLGEFSANVLGNYSSLESLQDAKELVLERTGYLYSYYYNWPRGYYASAPVPTPTPTPTPLPTPTPTPVIDLPDIDIGDVGISESKYQVTQEGIWFNDIYYAYDLEMRNFILDRDLQGYAVFYEKENNTLSVYWTHEASALIADFGLENGIYYMMVTDKTMWCMCQYTVNDDGTLTEKTAFRSHLDGYFVHMFFLNQYGNMENEDLLSEYISKCINESIVYSTIDILFADKSMCRNCDTGAMDWSYILNDIGSAVVEDWKASWEETLQKIYEYIEFAKSGINDIYRAIKEVSAEGKAPTITIHFDDFYGLNGDYEVLNFLWLLPYIGLVHLFLGVIIWISTIIWLVNYIPKLLGGIA